ncbi:ArsR/SmtB family transcription factor [Halolamina salifodinae]|uniref:DNA-binding transcriptional ArsR family regulator n=1 Tax=Halolamina salifodinae TaxID=1202767 RepID=A0A8T4GWS3_9EURY|nr:winged helix-turn-helix domain-containing protein [Halolamina salifodinae]MBP1987571.1 DNA-binding transcriptional ArsR family regulator [Halolamina salifodinae]
MSGLLPSESDGVAANEAEDDDGTRLLWLDDEEVDPLIGSLSSATARSLLTALHEERRTASELAEAVDTSLQNVRHHLGNLQDADLVEIAETRYSVKGREMKVYAPADDSLVVCVGDEAERSGLLDSIRNYVGAAAALVVGALLVQATVSGWTPTVSGPSGPRVADSVGTDALFGAVPPALLFVAGGLVALAAVAIQYRYTS